VALASAAVAELVAASRAAAVPEEEEAVVAEAVDSG